MIQHGYEFDSSWITCELKDGKTMQSVVCGHSERRALAFKFTHRSLSKFIQKVKKFRICGNYRKLVLFLLDYSYQYISLFSLKIILQNLRQKFDNVILFSVILIVFIIFT